MGKAPAFQLYASDFYVDTADWSVAEIGAYFRLLMAEWVNGPLPDDTKRLARIATLDHGNFVKLWGPTLQGKFVKNGNGTLYNRRLEEEREKQANYIEKQRIKGSKRAEKMWEGHIATAITTATQRLQPKDSSSSSTSSSTSLQKKKNVVKTLSDEEFFDQLSTNPAYVGIDIQLQYGKMKAWCEVNQKTPSRRRLVNWLNRADKPLEPERRYKY